MGKMKGKREEKQQNLNQQQKYTFKLNTELWKKKNDPQFGHWQGKEKKWGGIISWWRRGMREKSPDAHEEVLC